jgi:hypothetical protein
MTEEKQPSLFESVLKQQVEKLDEKLLALEVKLAGIEAGAHLIWQALEAHGLLKNGEVVQRAQSKQPRVAWDPSKIKWTEAEGGKGPYQRSEDINNPEFKCMLRDLATHGGKTTRSGYFYWVFQNGHVVGRKKRRK